MRAPRIALLCIAAAAAVALVLLVLPASRDGAEGRLPQAAPPAPAAVPAQPPPAERQTPVVVPPAAAPSAASSAAPSAVSSAAAKRAASSPGPVLSTFALSSDHRALLQDTPLAAADHRQLEHEPRDEAWAAASERLIREQLARHGHAGDFDVIAVDCRQTLCAIQAFSYGENGYREWVKAVDELYRDTLASLFDSVNTAFPTQGSRSPVLTFLHRRAAPAPP
jgi:hypothetical protein